MSEERKSTQQALLAGANSKDEIKNDGSMSAEKVKAVGNNGCGLCITADSEGNKNKDDGGMRRIVGRCAVQGPQKKGKEKEGESQKEERRAYFCKTIAMMISPLHLRRRRCQRYFAKIRIAS